jgi:hypothetical protein
MPLQGIKSKRVRMFFKRIELMSRAESVLREVHWCAGNLESGRGFHVPLYSCP